MGKRIQIQELIAISKTGEVLQSSVKELREQAWHVRGGKTEENRVERMATHIANLANEARIAHTKRGSSPESVLVTRLILNEFSLYTKDSPLNLSEYKLLIKKIHGITSTLPPDIHLLLATVPVLWSDNSVHNCALYTQSPLIAGGRPIIHHFSKEHASPVDFRYIDETTGGGFPLRGDAVGDHSPRVVLGDTEVNTGDFNQFGSAIKIVTSVGEAFITLIDICLDHRMRVAENNLINLITVLKKLGQLIPLYMSQVISSHSIPPIKKHLFVPLTQSDESCKRADGAKPEEEVHLPSSFGGFVDITKFPPIYLDIPYRKRILRHLSTAVAGEAILQETITNPGDLAYLYKRVNALAKMGVPLGPEAQVISELDFLQGDLFMP